MTTVTQPSVSSCASQFFNYRYPPFADTFEIQSPWQSSSETIMTQRALALIRQGKSLAIYGEAGTGKSMLGKAIADQLDTKNYRVAMLPYGGLKPAVIVREICEEFGIDVAGRKSCLCRLAKNFQRNSDKPFPVIIIDDAHSMLNQSFIDLCSLLHDAKSRTAAASLILLGQPVLKKMIELDIFAPVRTRLACLFMMSRLSHEEAIEFIQFRLKITQADPNLFDEQAMECIAADANGNRRVIMNIATLCMEEAARRKEKIITTEIVTAVAMEQIS
jgi:type II secretory pathway predicted ATPase ExeA